MNEGPTHYVENVKMLLLTAESLGSESLRRSLNGLRGLCQRLLVNMMHV